MIQVVNRAIDIIEFVANDGQRPKLLGEIANALDLNAATCANIVKTLVDRGYLQKSHGKGYLLGNQIYKLSDGAVNYQEIIEAADAQMELVRTKINECSLLAVLRENKRVVIYKKDAEQLIQAQTPNAKIAWDSSTGRILVAFLDDNSRDTFIDTYGLPTNAVWKEASTRKKFFEQVEKIRTQGYALTEDTSQITGVATPVFRNGKMVAAFSIYLPTFRYTSKLRTQLIRLSVNAAKQISGKLG